MWATSIGVSVLLCGCSAVDGVTNSIAQLFAVSEEETFAQEKQFLADYEAHKTDPEFAVQETWVQPVNKKEQCRIYLRYKKEDEAIKLGAGHYWDGACKDGYAYGLGREFARSEDRFVEKLADYKSPGQEPTYYYQKDKLGGIILNGVDYSGAGTVRGIAFQDNGHKLDYVRISAVEDKAQHILYARYEYPISGIELLVKRYPNFSYAFQFNKITGAGVASLVDEKSNTPSRYGFVYNAQGQHQGVQKISPTAQSEQTTLPESYWERLMSVRQEIISQLSESVLTSKENRAKIVKEEYMAQKCKARARAPFSSWPDYYDICNEDEFVAGLLTKVTQKIEERDARLAAVAQQRQQAALAQAQIQALNAQRNAAQAQEAVAALQQLSNSINQTNQNTWNMINMYNQSVQPMNTTVPSYVGNPNRGRITQCRVSSSGKWVNCFN